MKDTHLGVKTMLMNGDDLPAGDDAGETTEHNGNSNGGDGNILPPGGETEGGGRDADEAHADTDGDEDDDSDLSDGKFSAEQQKLLNKLLGKKNRKAREARREAESKAKEAEEARKEAESLRNTVGDETVMKAANAANILPEFLTKTEASAILKVNGLKQWRNFLTDQCGSEGFSGQFMDGRNVEWSPDECQRQAIRLTRQIEDEGDTARDAIGKAKKGLSELLELGRAAKKAGWKPGQRSAVAPTSKGTTPPVRQAAAGQTTVPQASTVRRSTSGTPPKAVASAFDSVKRGDKSALLAAIMADVGGR